MTDLLSLCDSYKKWFLFLSIATLHPEIDQTQLGDYQEEILVPRNFLAHGKPEKQDDGTLLFKHNDSEFEFSDDVSAVLRQSLQSYSEIFDNIIDQIT